MSRIFENQFRARLWQRNITGRFVWDRSLLLCQRSACLSLSVPLPRKSALIGRRHWLWLSHDKWESVATICLTAAGDLKMTTYGEHNPVKKKKKTENITEIQKRMGKCLSVAGMCQRKCVQGQLHSLLQSFLHLSQRNVWHQTHNRRTQGALSEADTYI